MTLETNDNTVIPELSMDELDSVAGGRFSWRGLLGAFLGGAATGAAGGAVAGGVGAGPGALGGGLAAGIGYCISSL
jgi:hypothetical protein